MHTRLDSHLLAPDLITRGLHASPEIERPLQAADFAARYGVSTRPYQAQASQIHDMLIVPHPRADRFRVGREFVPANIASLLERARRRHMIRRPALR